MEGTSIVVSPNASAAEITQRLRFEALLADISARFVAAHPDDIDHQLLEAQRLLSDALGVDRSTLWQVSPNDPTKIQLTHLHGSTNGRERPDTLDARQTLPWLSEQVIVRGLAVKISSIDQTPPDAPDRKLFEYYGTKSFIALPLSAGGGPVVGAISFDAVERERDWPDAIVTRCQLIAQIFANALARKRADQLLRASQEQVKQLQIQLQQENQSLRREVMAVQGQMPIVGNSDALRHVIAQTHQVASTDSTVLILGETGTGKELLASYLHRIGKRSSKPFVISNIAAIPSTLLESELFGRERGAYTGALTRQIGRLEMADGGTLFLDEIGELPLETQAKLLRVLQSRAFERLGSSHTIRVDVQIIAATNRKLPDLIRAGTFREDLFYRLNVFPLTLPPLRDRPDDIPVLVWAFVKEFADSMGKPIERIRKRDMDALQAYAWPGNVRELRNVVERSMILAHGPELRLTLPDSEGGHTSTHSRLLRDVERAHVLRVLASTGHRIRGPQGAAQILGLKPGTLYSLMGRLGIAPARKPPIVKR